MMPTLSSPFTIRTVAGRAVLAEESVECAGKEDAIELARARLVSAVPGVSVEVWAHQSKLWSSLTGSVLLALAQISELPAIT
jgi:hypothetical protein